MALTGSLRKVLLTLLTLTVFVLMVLYWNQGSMRPPLMSEGSGSNGLGGGSGGSACRNKKDFSSLTDGDWDALPVEKFWTYKCIGDRCVRFHYNNAEKTFPPKERRIPFMTCSMTCGEINIWPLPSIKSELSTQAMTFSVNSIRVQIDTRFKAVDKQIRGSLNIFRKHLQRLQRRNPPRNPSVKSASRKNAKGLVGSGLKLEDVEGVMVADDGDTISLSSLSSMKQQHPLEHQLLHDQEDEMANNNNGDDGVQNSPPRSYSSIFHGKSVAEHGNNGIYPSTGDRKRSFFVMNSKSQPSPSSYECCDINTFTIRITINKYSDIKLNLKTDESYRLTMSNKRRSLEVHINANSFFGARHGLATLEQLIWYDDEVELLHIIAKGIIIDEPKFPYRGIMLDTSRHYFSIDSIKRTIDGMAYVKLNRFHWHMTDSQSFPYLSKSYPELAIHGAYSYSETYSNDEIREIVEYAQINGIQIIPEIDAPAHAGNGWDWGPSRGLGELSLCINQQPWSFYCGEPPCGQLNPKNNNTYLILQKLYQELLELTGPTDYFHLGGDEVNLECWAQYFNDTDLRGLWCDFMMNALTRLRIANNNQEPRVVAVWSSGLTSTKCLPKDRFAVQVWGGSTWQENYDLIDNGFNVVFSHVDAWYLDCGFGNWRATGEGACSPYRTWQDVYKHRPWDRMHLDKLRLQQVLGGEACLWTEQVDESQLDNRLWPRSSALAERLWTDLEEEHEFEGVSQDVFKRMSVLRTRLLELGLKPEPIFPKYCYQNPGECL